VLLPDSAVASDKRARIQTYLEPEVAELIRKRAEEEDRPESREVSRLVRLGLEADAKNYVLGNRVFRTKADITAHVRQVRDAAVLGEPVTDEVVLALLRLHPEWDEKTAGGGWVGTALIDHPAKPRPTKEIAICFDDSDKVVDISWTKLLPFLKKGFNAPIASWDSRLSELRLAARQEIEPQVAVLRRKGCAVDHVYPLTFDQLLFDWLSSAALVVDDVPLSDGVGADTSRCFANAEQAKSWADYHAEHAVLETVTHEEHAKRTGRAQLDWTPLL
jgi:hypothetical protein